MNSEILFSGKHSEIVKRCPDGFCTDNKENTWVNFARHILSKGFDCKNWKYSNPDIDTQNHQRGCLDAVFADGTIDDLNKIAIAGWMLASMLTEVPTDIPPMVRKNLRKDPQSITRKKLARKKTA